MLHDGGGGDGVELLDDGARGEMEAFTRRKMEQLKAYKEESGSIFLKKKTG